MSWQVSGEQRLGSPLFVRKLVCRKCSLAPYCRPGVSCPSCLRTRWVKRGHRGSSRPPGKRVTELYSVRPLTRDYRRARTRLTLALSSVERKPWLVTHPSIPHLTSPHLSTPHRGAAPPLIPAPYITSPPPRPSNELEPVTPTRVGRRAFGLGKSTQTSSTNRAL